MSQWHRKDLSGHWQTLQHDSCIAVCPQAAPSLSWQEEERQQAFDVTSVLYSTYDSLEIEWSAVIRWSYFNPIRTVQYDYFTYDFMTDWLWQRITDVITLFYLLHNCITFLIIRMVSSHHCTWHETLSRTVIMQAAVRRIEWPRFIDYWTLHYF